MTDERIKITAKELEKFRQLGIINEVALRNIHIKRQYRRLKRTYPERTKELKEALANEYHLSMDMIRSILYDKRYSQKQDIIVPELR